MSSQSRFAIAFSLPFHFSAQYMAFSEIYKELLRIFSRNCRKNVPKHKKTAVNSSRIIFLPYICNVLLRNF